MNSILVLSHLFACGTRILWHLAANNTFPFKYLFIYKLIRNYGSPRALIEKRPTHITLMCRVCIAHASISKKFCPVCVCASGRWYLFTVAQVLRDGVVAEMGWAFFMRTKKYFIILKLKRHRLYLIATTNNAHTHSTHTQLMCFENKYLYYTSSCFIMMLILRTSINSYILKWEVVRLAATAYGKYIFASFTYN